MAKEQPSELEPLEEQKTYFIEQCLETPFMGQWIIYSKTKYGKKMFNNYYFKEDALRAAKYYNLTLLSD